MSGLLGLDERGAGALDTPARAAPNPLSTRPSRTESPLEALEAGEAGEALEAGEAGDATPPDTCAPRHR